MFLSKQVAIPTICFFMDSTDLRNLMNFFVSFYGFSKFKEVTEFLIGQPLNVLIAANTREL